MNTTANAFNPLSISYYTQILNDTAAQISAWFPDTANQLNAFNANKSAAIQQLQFAKQNGLLDPARADTQIAQQYTDQALGNLGAVSARLPIIGNIAGFIASQPWVSSAISSPDPAQRVLGLSEIVAQAAVYARLLLQGGVTGLGPETSAGSVAASIGTRLGVGAAIGAPLYTVGGALLGGETSPSQVASNILSGASTGATFAGVLGGLEGLPYVNSIGPYLQKLEDPATGFSPPRSTAPG